LVDSYSGDTFVLVWKAYMRYKAIALDLDGTLTDGNKKLPERNKEAVFKAIDAGVSVILASGRPPFGVEPIARELELYSRGGYILACNSGVIINCKTGEIMDSTMLPSQCIPDICRISRANGVYALTYAGTEILSESETDEYVIKEAICNYTTIKLTDSVEDYVTYPVPKFLIVGPHERLLPVQRELLDRYPGVLDAFFSEDYFLEVVPFGIAKDKGLVKLLDKLGIDSSELIACGDGMNDIPMLQYAGLAAVMDNAYPEVKKYADLITATNDNCGVADVIEQYILDETTR